MRTSRPLNGRTLDARVNVLPIRHTPQLDSVLILLVVGLGVAMVIAGWFLLTRWNRRRARAITLIVTSAIVLTSLTPFVYLQRHSGLGILAFRGANYWVHRASVARTPEEEQECLWFVLTSSNYGVNAAESAVCSLRDPARRQRLFETLARITPIERWREVYQRHAEQAKHERSGT